MQTKIIISIFFLLATTWGALSQEVIQEVKENENYTQVETDKLTKLNRAVLNSFDKARSFLYNNSNSTCNSIKDCTLLKAEVESLIDYYEFGNTEGEVANKEYNDILAKYHVKFSTGTPFKPSKTYDLNKSDYLKHLRNRLKEYDSRLEDLVREDVKANLVLRSSKPKYTEKEMRKEMLEFREKQAAKSAEIQRIRQANNPQTQQSITQNNVQAIQNAQNAANEYIQNTFGSMAQMSNSYQVYRRKVEASSRLSNSEDPQKIIREYNNKIANIERINNQRYAQSVKEINTYVARQQSASYTTALDKSAYALAGTISKMNASKEIERKKTEAIEKLKKEKTDMFMKIKNDVIRDLKKERDSWHQRAAAEVIPAKEIYYQQMEEYFNCKISRVEANFSINNTNWLDPYCQEVKKDNTPPNDNPTDKELYAASIRKYKSSDGAYQKASKDFIEMALSKNSKVSAYYYHRSKFEEVGTKPSIYLLTKALELDPKNIDIKRDLTASMVEFNRIEETTFFDADWKTTEKRKSVYYRPLPEHVNNVYHIKDYYSSNDQLQSEFYSKTLNGEEASLVGKSIRYSKQGKILEEKYYNNGISKQNIIYQSNGSGKVSLRFLKDGKKIAYTDVSEFGKIHEVNYYPNSLIKFMKWDYNSSKSKNDKFYGFNFDENGNLISRYIYNKNGKIVDKDVENDIDAINKEALIFINEENYHDAIKLLERGISTYPNNSLMLYYLGFSKGRSQMVLTKINGVIEDNLNLKLLETNNKKNKEEAIGYFKRAIQHCDNDTSLLITLYENLADDYSQTGNFNESLSAYKKGLALNNDNTKILNNYSKTLAKIVHDLDTAEEMIVRCNKIKPNDYTFQDTYALVLYKKGNYEGANEWLDKAINNGGEKVANIWELKGDISYKQGKNGEALRYWNKAKSIYKKERGEVSPYLNKKIKKQILIE